MIPGTAPALALRGIHKRFGATPALTDATLCAAPGTVHAVLGENGAGKTTLLRIAFGLVPADQGTVERDGVPIRPRSPRDAMDAGIGMVHQHYSLVPSMTVAENVVLGGHGLLREAAAEDVAERAASSLGFSVDPRTRTGDLSVAAQQRIELTKALARSARVLILDEPTAVLAPAEAELLLTRLRAFAAGGGTVILITHHLREALRYADDITVLRAGRTVLTASAASVSEDALITAMVGERLRTRDAPAERGAPGDVVMATSEVSVQDARGTWRLRDATVAVRGGEILGVAGVDGNGRHELVRVLAGRIRPHRGTAHLPPAVGFVPEDRHRDALLLTASLTENLALAGAGSARGRVPWRQLAADAAALIEAFDVRGATPHQAAGTLSGGNQQKFVLGRAVYTAPMALVAESPSRGLDVRATRAIHDALRARRDEGAAIVVTSPDLDELLALADRVVVCYGGSVHAVARDSEQIGRAMVGAID